MSDFTIRVSGVRKTFSASAIALTDVNLQVGTQGLTALLGSSGSGKSTLLRIMAGLLPADAHPDYPGLVEVHHRVVQSHGRIRHAAPRVRAEIAFIFQQFNLVPRLSLLDNVLIGSLARQPPLRSLTGWFPRAERERAMHALDRVGMAHFAARRASQLSGGQQQRAAIARALVQGARVVLADEPIASLDPVAARRVMELLVRINREDGVTVLVSLHQVDIAREFCSRVIALTGGTIRADAPPDQLDAALLNEIYAAGHLEPEHQPN